VASGPKLSAWPRVATPVSSIVRAPHRWLPPAVREYRFSVSSSRLMSSSIELAVLRPTREPSGNS
jgi:hypothetical protein